jgi:L-alanine-DL-glutamate epimerase-like enolase superfamily enzyme
VLEAGGLAILQPDLSHAGGITECYKIAGMAEAHALLLEYRVARNKVDMKAGSKRNRTERTMGCQRNMFSRFEFKSVLEAGGLAILQPDLSHAGGITECYNFEFKS